MLFIEEKKSELYQLSDSFIDVQGAALQCSHINVVKGRINVGVHPVHNATT